jgi:hypothetical protein
MNEATPQAPKPGALFPALLGLAVVLSLVYSIYACFSPYAEPAASFIEWQARWGQGRYYVKATFLATWLNLLLVGGIAISSAWAPYYAATSLFSGRVQLPDGPQWQSLAASGWRLTVAGVLAGFVPSVALYFLLLTEPETFAWMGTGSVALFMLLPMLAGWGWFSLLNLVLPRRRTAGLVTAVRENRDQNGNSLGYVAAVNGEDWTVPLETWKQLAPGTPVAIVAPALTNTAVSIKAQRTVTYR